MATKFYSVPVVVTVHIVADEDEDVNGVAVDIATGKDVEHGYVYSISRSLDKAVEINEGKFLEGDPYASYADPLAEFEEGPLYGDMKVEKEED